MGAKRRRIEAALKAKAALAAVRGDRTTGELAGQFGVHPTQIGQWKRQLLDGATELFSGDQRHKVEINGLIVSFWKEHVLRRYVKNGCPTTESRSFATALRPVRERYGTQSIALQGRTAVGRGFSS